MAASLSILAIFFPVLFMQGVIGKFFFQFGMTMSVAVFLSLIEALTLTPMRCSQFLEPTFSERKTHADRVLECLSNRYAQILDFCLRFRGRIILGSFFFFIASFFLWHVVKTEFVRPQDQGRLLVTVQLHRRPTQQEWMAFFRKEVQAISGIERVSILDLSLSGLSPQRGSPIEFLIQGPDWDRLAQFNQEWRKWMQDSSWMTDIDTDYHPNMPELLIVPDREKAAQRRVSIKAIVTTIQVFVSGIQAGTYTDAGGHQDAILIKAKGSQMRNIEDLKRIHLRNLQGEMVPLSELVEVSERKSLLTVNRYNRQRAMALYAGLAPGVSQGKVLDEIQAFAKKLPEGFSMVFSGHSKGMKESFQNLLFALGLGILVAYMVLGAQFNSFVDPLSILWVLPLSVTGALLALWMTGHSLNVYSFIGLLLLMGIVKKNAILLVDLIVQTRRAQPLLSLHEVIVKACPLGLRPVLMTSCATIAGALPAACSMGAGGEASRAMAVVVLGGVLFSTALSLFLVPCCYAVLAQSISLKTET